MAIRPQSDSAHDGEIVALRDDVPISADPSRSVYGRLDRSAKCFLGRFLFKRRAAVVAIPCRRGTRGGRTQLTASEIVPG
jgi:hypothetical protein